MAGVRSCVINQFSLMEVRQRFAHISRKRLRIGVVFFGQSLNDLAQCSSITARENFVRGFVQFDDAFREKQHVFAGSGIDLQSNSLRKARLS